MTQRPLRIATRSSRLAMWQANHVAELLKAADPQQHVELIEVSTSGDRDRVQPLHELGGVGVFTREVQRAVLDDRADLAVHSLKDLPTEPVKGLTLAAVPPRASCFDALVLPWVLPGDDRPPSVDTGNPLASDNAEDWLRSLPDNARVGTGSLRRKAQLLHVRSRLQIDGVRGNVETRLKKLDDGQFNALVLAEAGLQRLGMAHRISARLKPPLLLPAVGQGALGIECRADDSCTQQLLQAIDDAEARFGVTAERALLAELRAGCHAPVGVLSGRREDRWTLEAVVLSPDGTERLQAAVKSGANDAPVLGRRVAEQLQQQGAARLINPAG